ncbi:hypothetical protein LUZ60_011926 [Juncus effusus]|nr:hypothetical protein LUZ60_011926 [Juncus effusus]
MGAQKPYSKRKSTSLQDLFNQNHIPNSQNTLTKLPEPPNYQNTLLPQPPFIDSETEKLISRIKSCNQIFTFTVPTESRTDRDSKQQNLSQILTFLRTNKEKLEHPIITSLISMVSKNLFVPLPAPTKRYQPFELLEDDLPVIMVLPSWPHLEIIYEILSNLVKNLDPKSMKINGINRAFLSNLAVRFQSEDSLERERLKNIYHLLYTKLMHERCFMRKCMNNTLLQFALESCNNEKHFGIKELLEIYGSIINGFAVPLKEEHKIFLKKVLVPLHKPKTLGFYHKQLSYCMMEFVKKDTDLAELVLFGLLRCWPLTNCQKEVLLIGELEELFEVLVSKDSKLIRFEKLVVQISARIVKCINSCNSQVAERALYILHNEKFLKTATNLKNEILPPFVFALQRNLKNHWSKSVEQVTICVKNLLEGIDPSFYCKCVEQFELQEIQMRKKELERRMIWEMLEKLKC